jgi:hypothetical protein
LNCYLSTKNNDPFLLIGPIKEEVFSLDPFVAVYHDIVSKKTARAIINMAKSKVSYNIFK